ncbi:DUF4230 domain-containing protein [Chondromyces apiculatus]|uniref:DUF4230 domain-containing protein n=1 Tax=Chondromyces apiculatus DSM 436 TaxID=1192034 RepID=A0A017T538_9BACT|nr:DUF4230 domain-containing protein [Chondromyces apiculatus]EYF04092.1 Hypothetical protein CAP_4775 [Chondromyces apiculatus DSM 436]
MSQPINDPYAGGRRGDGLPLAGVDGADTTFAARRGPRPASSVLRGLGVALVAAALGAGGAIAVMRLATPDPAPGPVVRPTATIVTAIRDLSRLETAEVHVEKVVDLSDRQSRFFGLIQARDALLLVAAGQATLGVDLSKVRDGDISLDPETGVARLVLPEPEVFSARLDEQGTYVYTRATDLLARRNEQLEARARQEAIRAIERAAIEADALSRARAQAERQLTALATQLGARQVEISWRKAPTAPGTAPAGVGQR